jgi:hypothetical protein
MKYLQSKVFFSQYDSISCAFPGCQGRANNFGLQQLDQQLDLSKKAGLMASSLKGAVK